MLCEIINNVLGSVEIPQFKREKQQQYYEMMETVSDRELAFLASYGEFMKSVMDGLGKMWLVMMVYIDLLADWFMVWN